MKRVYKYPLGSKDQQEIMIPAGSKILSVETQDEHIVLYALVDDKVTHLNTYLVIIHGTGHNADDTEDCDFVGTVKLYGGALMFHVFTRRIYNGK